MGYTYYSSSDREIRAKASRFLTNSINENFQQNKKRIIHESMDPKSIKIRECLDSAEHPNTFPIKFAMDTTGSMLGIPQYLVIEGLPKIMGKLIQSGIPDAALLFTAVGDHEYDKYPLQVGQFESGDAELDMWLTRTYLERGGGGNAGESYMLAWYFAAFHTKLDHFDKRGKKGLLFTCGDEPNLPNLPLHAIKGLMDYGNYKTFTSAELLAEAQKMYHVYHLHMMHTEGAVAAAESWKKTLGQNCICIDNQEDVADQVIKIALKHAKETKLSPTPPRESSAPPEEEML